MKKTNDPEVLRILDTMASDAVDMFNAKPVPPLKLWGLFPWQRENKATFTLTYDGEPLVIEYATTGHATLLKAYLLAHGWKQVAITQTGNKVTIVVKNYP
ncbi:MAG: hypothetical protein WAX89_05825 [Alphaproteobacteria bacterium]